MFWSRFSRAVAMLLLTSFCFDVHAEALRFAEYSPNRGVRGETLSWLADEVRKRSNGALTLEMHWGEALLKAEGTLKGIGDGVADMGTVTSVYTPREMLLYLLGDIPMANSDPWVGMRAMQELVTTVPEFKKAFDVHEIVYLANFSTGPVQLVCKRPLANLAELKGLKIRGTGPYAKTFGELGASMQRMPQPDVYQALDSGLLDCNQNYYYGIRTYRQYEVARNLIELNWGQNLGWGIFANKRKFYSLPPGQQRMLTALGKDFTDHFARAIIDANAQDREAMLQDTKKVTLVVLLADQRTQLIKLGDKRVGEWVEQATKAGYPAQSIVQTYMALIVKYENERDTKGYPWKR